MRPDSVNGESKKKKKNRVEEKGGRGGEGNLSSGRTGVKTFFHCFAFLLCGLPEGKKKRQRDQKTKKKNGGMKEKNLCTKVREGLPSEISAGAEK